MESVAFLIDRGNAGQEETITSKTIYDVVVSFLCQDI